MNFSTALLIFSISSWFRLGRCIFVRICPFLPGCPFYWYVVAYSTLMILCISVVSVLTSLFSFLILLICMFSLFYWWVWLKDYEFCWSFQIPAFDFIGILFCFFIFHLFLLWSFFFFFFGLLAISRAAPMRHGSSQARGQIWAVATSLCQCHSNAGSMRCLQPTPQLMATPDP